MRRIPDTGLTPSRRAFLATVGIGAAIPVAAQAGGSGARPGEQGLVTPQAFGAVGDGRNDDAAAFQAAFDAALASGRTLSVPPGTYRMGQPIILRVRSRGDGLPFVPGPRLVGAGTGATVFEAPRGQVLFDIDGAADRGSPFFAAMGSRFEGFTVRGPGAAAIRLRGASNVLLRDLHIEGLPGNGIEIVCHEGDHDACNMVAIEQVRIDRCGGWGISAIADPGFNEISFLALRHVFIQRCGEGGSNGGGMRWKGQICELDQCAFTLNRNVALLVPGEAGLAQSLHLIGTTFENNFDRQLVVTGLVALKARNLQFYCSGTANAAYGCDLDGRQHPIRFVDIDGVVVRAAANVAPHVAFRLSGTHAERDTCRIRNVVWDDFDYPGQTRFEGFLFDPIIQGCGVRVISPTEAVFEVDPARQAGGGTPIRLGGATSATGEWAWRSLSSPLPLRASGLAASRLYHVYLWDDRNVKRLELSPVAPVLDRESGYLVLPDNASRLFVGTVRTDAGGRFAPPA